MGRTNVRTPIETIAAHHDGEDWTEEELEKIGAFKEFVKMRRQQKKDSRVGLIFEKKAKF